jgi:hypothetical protein
MRNPFEATAGLSPEQLEELARGARKRAAQAAADAPSVRVRVVLTEGHTLKARASDDPPAADDVTGRALARLSPQLKAALIEAEPKVMAWLRASHANRVKYTLDPVGSLKEIVRSFDKKLIDEIIAVRQASARIAVDVPGVKLDSFVLEVEPADGRRRGAQQQDGRRKQRRAQTENAGRQAR